MSWSHDRPRQRGGRRRGRKCRDYDWVAVLASFPSAAGRCRGLQRVGGTGRCAPTLTLKGIVMYGVGHIDGSGDDNPPVESISDLYDELLTSGIVDGSVAVMHDDSGWCMSAHRDGRLVFEHLGERGTERHMIPVPKGRVLELWRRLIVGDIDGLLKEPWKPGYVERE